MALDKALSLDPETSALLLVFSTGALVGLQTLRTFVATQLGYKVLWNISIKEPRNTGFPDRMVSYFFSPLCEGQHSLLQWTETFLFHLFRGVSSYTKLLHLIVDYARDSGAFISTGR